MNSNKGLSPFYPGQPVPVELFVGRASGVARIMRAIGQVELGKPQALFLSGEYGIGKSSLAAFMRHFAEKSKNFLGIHVFLGGARSIEDVATKTVETVLRSQVYSQKITEKIGNFLSKYAGKQKLFGFSINLEALKADGPTLSQGFLSFFQDLMDRVRDEGVNGLLLTFDEINGISNTPEFAHLIKSLVDENALSPKPVPLLLLLCGVEERRREMIRQHQPIERIFEIVEIDPMSVEEMQDFFSRAFGSQDIEVSPDAMSLLCHYSAGFPKIMHLIGDAVFWLDQDNKIDSGDAAQGIIMAAEDVGKKFVDQQVYKALRSKDYHSILNKLGREQFDLAFSKAAIEKGLSAVERKKLNNFLQRMKRLKVISSGEQRGSYVFNNRMVRLYILLNSLQADKPRI